MISISKVHLDAIRRHAEQDYPYECCGLIIGSFDGGSAKRASEVVAISNARDEEEKRNRFLIRPEELLRGDRYARDRQKEVIGFYHSHPDHPAEPSAYDLEHAWPAYSYIIVSVSGGVSRDIKTWEMEPDRSRFNPEGLQQQESEGVVG